ncbi:MAG: hypothetical protein ABI357_05685 [Granulicella sp.]
MPILLGILITLCIFLLNRRYGSFLGDEGYLWYGVQRVLQDEIPVRDFMSYEVGRYYISAAMLGAFGTHTILALRASLAVIMAAGLCLSIGLVSRAWDERRALWLLLPALLLAVWMVPRHKIFDIVISVVLVAAVAQVISRPRLSGFFWLGVATGLAAVIGQNHGLYALVASSLTFLLIFVEMRNELQCIRCAGCWAGGVVIGYLPVIGFACFVPGYLDASMAALKFIFFEYKGTNLPLPVPWPWRASTFEQFAVGLCFVGMLIANVSGLVLLARGAWKRVALKTPIFAGAVIVAIPYTDVAFARADSSHLAQALLPTLIALLALPVLAAGSQWKRRLLWPCALLLVSCVAAVPLHPRFQASIRDWKNIDLDGSVLTMDAGAVDILETVTGIRRRYGIEDSVVLAVPMFPGMNAALEQRNPTWEIYPLFPRNSLFQKQEIARIQSASNAVIVVSTLPLDGRPQLSYMATHPDIYRYIVDHCNRIPEQRANSSLEFYLCHERAFR